MRIRHRGTRSLVVAPAIVALLGPAVVACAVATDPAKATASAGRVCRSALPPEARDTIALIARGGPFPYRQDGEVFENREHVLPREPYGYYHEYTVAAPGAPTRGARRIVTARSGVDYYTADHYASFRTVDPGC